MNIKKAQSKMQKRIDGLKKHIKILNSKNNIRLKQARQDHYEMKIYERILKIFIPVVCRAKDRTHQENEALSEIKYYLDKVIKSKKKWKSKK